MQEENKFSYRSLNQSKEKEWHFARGLNDITTAGNYAVRLYHDDLEAIGISTAECDTEHYVVAHLVVIESAATGKQQKMRTIGQTLMFTTCTNQSMKIITRICVLTPDGVVWHPWVDSKAGTDYLPTAQELNTTAGRLDNKFVYKGSGDVDIVSGGYFDKTANDITLNLKKWGDTTGLGCVRHTIAAATEAMAGVMSAEDKITLKSLYNKSLISKTDFELVETPARIDNVVKASIGFAGYRYDLKGLYSLGFRYIRFRGANDTLNNDIVRGLIVNVSGEVESSTVTVTENSNGWEELPITVKSKYLKASYTKAGPNYGELFEPEYVELLKAGGEVARLQTSVEEIKCVTDTAKISSFNMLNSNDLLTGYSLSSGQIISNENGIFSNKLFLETGKAYTIKDVSTFQHGELENNAVAIFIAKFNSSDAYLGRDSIKPLESPILGDGYVTVGYTPTDETVAYYRVLLQSQSNLEHPYDATRAMVYEGTDEIDVFIPYNPIPVFAYNKVQDAKIAVLDSKVTAFENETNFERLNLLNPDDLLIGYSLSGGNFVTNENGIFSNKLFLEIGKSYTIKDVSTFQHGELENNAVAIFIAKFNSSDVYLGRDSIKPSESPTLGDGYITIGYTPTDETVAYYRVLLQSQSNLEHPYDATRAMVYKGSYVIEEFIPYNPILVFNYDKVQDARITLLESKITDIPAVEPTDKSGGILLTGASFAYNANTWFSKVCKDLNLRDYNKAVSGESIRHTAVKMHNGTLYSKAEFENFDTLLIMHVHNQDVCDDIDLQENYSDYEVSTSMSYSQAYDYVLKKYAAECYAAKDNPESKWYGTQCGKPCKVMCMTHWHDSRTVFNDSIRRLRDKWGFGLIELDKNIGFSKNSVHPVTGGQVSVIHAQDTEVIDGVTYGWHPSRATDAYIQDRIAEIVVKQLSI